MSVLLYHPVLSVDLASRCNRLLRTYIELDEVYWIDLLSPFARPRLTNTRTGEYVIFGNPLSTKSNVSFYRDEYFCTVVPGPKLRVKVAHNTFDCIDVDLVDRAEASGIYCERSTGNTILVRRVHVSEKTITGVRMAQHVAISPNRLAA